jgi:hypothetical protein
MILTPGHNAHESRDFQNVGNKIKVKYENVTVTQIAIKNNKQGVLLSMEKNVFRRFTVVIF